MTARQPIRFASVCDGISAVGVAWRKLGWRFVFKSEVEAFPSAVADLHHPEAPNLGDMTKHNEWDEKAYGIDLICGGTPCQAFSVAGLRKGLADPRGNLTLTYLAIIAKFKPRWVVWENVPGVHSSWSDAAVRGATEEIRQRCDEARRVIAQSGFGPDEKINLRAAFDAENFEEVDQSNDFDCFLAGLEQLGYGIATRILDAQYCGVAQRRRRVFVVGHIGGLWQRAAAVLFERDCLSGNPAPRRESGKGFTYDAAPCLGASGRGVERAGETRGQDPVIAIQEVGKRTGVSTTNRMHGSGIGDEGGPMFTLQSSAQHGIAQQVSAGNDARSVMMRGREGCDGGGKGPLLSVEKSLTLAANANDQVLFQNITPNLTSNGDAHSGFRDEHGLVAHALRGEGFDASEDGTGRGTPLVLAHGQAGAERVSDGSPSLTCNHEAPIAFLSESGAHRDAATMAVRRLTPRECERLQGFPDDYTLIQVRNKPAADGPRYKALGNSMAVPVMRWIGERIQLVETLCPLPA